METASYPRYVQARPVSYMVSAPQYASPPQMAAPVPSPSQQQASQPVHHIPVPPLKSTPSLHHYQQIRQNGGDVTVDISASWEEELNGLKGPEVLKSITNIFYQTLYSLHPPARSRPPAQMPMATPVNSFTFRPTQQVNNFVSPASYTIAYTPTTDSARPQMQNTQASMMALASAAITPTSAPAHTAAANSSSPHSTPTLTIPSPAFFPEQPAHSLYNHTHHSSTEDLLQSHAHSLGVVSPMASTQASSTASSSSEQHLPSFSNDLFGDFNIDRRGSLSLLSASPGPFESISFSPRRGSFFGTLDGRRGSIAMAGMDRKRSDAFLEGTQFSSPAVFSRPGLDDGLSSSLMPFFGTPLLGTPLLSSAVMDGASEYIQSANSATLREFGFALNKGDQAGEHLLPTREDDSKSSKRKASGTDKEEGKRSRSEELAK
eukprot:TRINITY_DN6319_c0_g1_i2.p1 TRINITY_DN6319_c0_g1~~TRINITY_DN6319_c0_g1_i2.p1  ORF type:complete len:470 (+),score=97.62 TRINITY_DN6319_c0_g1_i2:113-1411(+)